MTTARRSPHLVDARPNDVVDSSASAYGTSAVSDGKAVPLVDDDRLTVLPPDVVRFPVGVPDDGATLVLTQPSSNLFRRVVEPLET